MQKPNITTIIKRSQKPETQLLHLVLFRFYCWSWAQMLKADRNPDRWSEVWRTGPPARTEPGLPCSWPRRTDRRPGRSWSVSTCCWSSCNPSGRGRSFGPFRSVWRSETFRSRFKRFPRVRALIGRRLGPIRVRLLTGGVMSPFRYQSRCQFFHRNTGRFGSENPKLQSTNYSYIINKVKIFT